MMRRMSVSEASAELRRYGEAAKVYAGGSELLILLHHGLIECESVPGRTDFLILIPLP